MIDDRKEVLIGVGSKNPTKIKATKNAFNIYYRINQFYSFQVDSKVPDQPIGFNETIKGAITRGKKALSLLKSQVNGKHSLFGVGIEAGLIKVPYTISGFMDFQFCAIIDEIGRVSLGNGVSFEYPPQIIDQILQNQDLEIGILIGNLANNSNLKNESGAIGFLSKNKMNRTELLTNAVICALNPRINKDLYYEKIR